MTVSLQHNNIDKNKNVQAAELQRYASELMTARTKQEIENVHGISSSTRKRR